jgi:hypothetical protein
VESLKQVIEEKNRDEDLQKLHVHVKEAAKEAAAVPQLPSSDILATSESKVGADAVRDLLAEDDQEFLPANNGGRAAGGGAVDDGRHRGDADYTRPKRDRGRDRRRAKNGGSHYVGREDHSNLFPTNDGVHAWAGGFQEDYGCCKPERRREDDKASWYLDATPEEIEAAKGLLMLKYALLAQRRYY